MLDIEHWQTVNRSGFGAHPIVANHRGSLSLSLELAKESLVFAIWAMPAIIAAAVFEVTRRAGLSSSVVEQRTCNAQVVSSILTGGSGFFYGSAPWFLDNLSPLKTASSLR